MSDNVTISQKRYDDLVKKEKSLEGIKTHVSSRYFLNLLIDIKKNSPEYFNGDYGKFDLLFYFEYLVVAVDWLGEDTLDKIIDTRED